MSASDTDKSLADFVRDLALLQDNQHHGSLSGKVVVDLGGGDARLHELVLAAGAASLCTVQPPGLDADARMHALPADAAAPYADVAFFDARAQAGFDHVQGVTGLVARMRQVLRADGVAFAVLLSGAVNHGFDVYNPIVRSARHVLPSQDYLFRELLRDCTIRMLGWTPTTQRYETVRFLRLSLKKPTLLLVLGRSHSGKTSLARDFQSLDETMHVSNDYIYCEIVAKQQDGQAQAFPQELVTLAGDGSGKACGAFNRQLESDPGLLRIYLEWLAPLLPRNKRIVSMDFDLVDAQQVNLAKAILTEAGFSVWVVQR